MLLIIKNLLKTLIFDLNPSLLPPTSYLLTKLENILQSNQITNSMLISSSIFLKTYSLKNTRSPHLKTLWTTLMNGLIQPFLFLAANSQPLPIKKKPNHAYNLKSENNSSLSLKPFYPPLYIFANLIPFKTGEMNATAQSTSISSHASTKTAPM